MSRENTYTAIILKKQPYGEGDEIVTLFTLEAGKIRAMGKSTKFARSKLQYSLQGLFEVRVTVIGNTSLPKIIAVEVLNTFSEIRESMNSLTAAFFGVELLIKFTADEQKNEQLYNLFIAFFGFLNNVKNQDRLLTLGLAKFKIQFLENLGLAINFPSNTETAEHIGFSNSHGGFVTKQEAADFLPVIPETFTQFMRLKNISSDQIKLSETESLAGQDITELNELLNNFLRYQLERDIKSERFLEM